MFPIFELARLLNFRSDANKQEPTLTIKDYAWKENGERSVLAVLFSNGYFLLRLAVHGKPPVCRQLPWYQDRHIQAITFDPTGTWLLCLTSKEALYIIPVLQILRPEEVHSKSRQPWKSRDITKVKYKKKRGTGIALCLAWWHSSIGKEIALIGTKTGFIFLVDLSTDKVLCEFNVNEEVSSIKIVPNEGPDSTSVLVSTKSNSHWRIGLEERSPSNSSAGRGSCQEDKNERPRVISLSGHRDQEYSNLNSSPQRYDRFSSETLVTNVFFEGKHRIQARNLHSNSLGIHEANIGASVVGEFKIPEYVNEVIVTDRLLFLISPTDPSSVEIKATKLRRTNPLEKNGQQVLLQKFDLRSGERIIATFKRSFPFDWHDYSPLNDPCSSSRPDSSIRNIYSGIISSHTVLDGCVILTTQNIYECRPRVSPEALFVDLVVTQGDFSSAENLALVLGLDTSKLYSLAAKFHLSNREFSNAARLFQLAKCPHLQRVGAFAEYGCMSEVLKYLQRTLNSDRQELEPCVTGELSCLTVLAFIQQLLEDANNSNTLMQSFRDFLRTNTLYDTKEALHLLVIHGFHDLMLDIGEARNCVVDAIIEIFSSESDTNEDSEVSTNRPLQDPFQSVNMGLIVRHLNSTDVLQLEKVNEPVFKNLFSHILMSLGDLDDDTLMIVTQLVDISSPSYREVLHLNGITKHNDSQPLRQSSIQKIVEIFAQCVITLNSRQDDQDLDLDFHEEGFSPPCSQPFDPGNSVLQDRMTVRKQILSATSNSSAMVHKGNLYGWGDMFLEERRKGGVVDHTVCFWQPYSPDALGNCNVLSVDCGVHHSMALTNQWVYSWGDNRFGQLGFGNREPISSIQRVTGLEDVCVVNIKCGHYHSLVLSDDCRAYSWGWGVHGQLAHGSVNDCSNPEVVSFSGATNIVDIAAGYAHSLFCTDKGEVYVCGSSIFGQLGLGSTFKVTSPRHVTGLKDRVVSVETKDFSNLALTEDGSVFQWGSSPSQLSSLLKDQRQARIRGIPTRLSNSELMKKHLSPRPLDTSCVGAKVVQVKCGGTFNAMLTVDGEVFTWGKNTDGQLGIGNRNDQRIPMIVNRINDRRIASLACGVDHVLAMDTESQVWAWGRNDHGQLALVTSHGACPSGGEQGIYVSMGIFSAVWPVKVPSLGKLTSTSTLTCFPHPSTTETVSRWERVLPRLHPYRLDCLFILLQAIPITCDPASWLQTSLKYDLPVTSGSLALHAGSLSQALRCHLQVFSKSSHADVTTVAKILEQIAHFYLRKAVSLGNLYNKTESCMVEGIISLLAEFWTAQKYRMETFTTIISEYLPALSWNVFVLLARSTGAEDVSSDGSSATATTSPKLPKELIDQLDTSFCLEVTSHAVKLVEDNKIPKEQMSNLFPVISHVPPDEKPGNSSERLWEEVFCDLRKKYFKWPTIDITGSDMNELLSKSSVLIDPLSGPLEQAREVEDVIFDSVAVVFSCGHNMSRDNLLQEALPELERELATLDLHESGKFFLSHFKQTGVIPSACPSCVLHCVKNS